MLPDAEATEDIDWMSYDDEDIEDGVERATGLDVSVAQGRINELLELIQAFHAEHGRLPDDLGETAEQRDPDADPLVIPDSIVRVPADPWGQPYEYTIEDATSYRLRSYGPDTKPDTDDDLVGSGAID